jgi:hypothetical protein
MASKEIAFLGLYTRLKPSKTGQRGKNDYKSDVNDFAIHGKLI